MNRRIVMEVKQHNVKVRRNVLPQKCLALYKRQSFLLTVHQISNPGMKSHRG